MRELHVVRHGESEGNAQRIAQGRLPYPLTAKGRTQAESVASLFERVGWKPTYVLTSPLRRCMETADILVQQLGLCEPVTDDAFTEIDCGSATGRPFAELEKEHPGFFNRPASEWLGFQELGGESDEQLIERVAEGISRFPPEESILLVTHGAVFKGILTNLLGFDTQFFLGLRTDSVLRLERRTIGTSEVVALTHFLHAQELA